MHQNRTNLLRNLSAASLALAATIPTQAAAQSLIPGYPPQVTAYDPREVGRLPGYCRYTQDFRIKVPGGNDPAQVSHWQSVMGSGPFNSMHHYCWGLMKLNRALYLARSQQARSFYFRDAILEFNYVLEHVPENFVLRPEILTKKGQCLIRVGNGPLAVVELERAIELKPDYWPPYVQLSDYYKEVGQAAQAREVLQKALSFSPDSATVKQRLAELDGSGAKQGKGGK